MTEEDHLKPRENNRVKQSCMHWFITKLKLTEEGATPPNWKYIFLMFAALFSSANIQTFLFPFLPEMILHLGYSENEKGTYAGLVASSVFAGSIFGSVFWGWLADHRGRKLVLLLTISLNGIFVVLFGFSTNLIMAMLFRFLSGLVSGTIATAKAVLYGISDDTNQAVSMCMLSLSWGVGMVIGPALGGLLADPARKWPGIFSSDGLFGEYPYLLPSLLPFFFCCGISTLIFFKFDENCVGTTSQRRKIPEITVEVPAHNERNEQEDGHAPLLMGRPSTDHGGSLARIGLSMNSIHAEADARAFFARDMLKKRETAAAVFRSTKSSPASTKFVSVPDLTNPVTSVPSVPAYPAHWMSLSTPDIRKSSPSRVLSTASENQKRQIKLSALENGEVWHSVKERSETQGNVPREVEIGEDKMSVVDSVVFQNNAKPCDGIGYPVSETQLGSDGGDTLQEEEVCRCVELCFSSTCCLPCRKSSLFQLLRQANVWATMMLYVVYAFINMAVDEMFPVFASTRVDYGGLGFSTDQIGIVLGSTFLPLILLEIKLYPLCVSKFGIRKVFLISAIVCLLAGQIIPTVRLLNNQPIWLWVCLMAAQILFQLSANWCFTGTALLINNAIPPHFAGQANGLAMTITAFGRFLAPIFGGSLFSWSVTYGPGIGVPFDTSFPFFVIGSLFFVSVVNCLVLDPRLDRQNK